MSMPGMMDTVLNLGLNDQSRQGLATLTKNERSRRRVPPVHLDVRPDRARHRCEEVRRRPREAQAARGAKSDTDLGAKDLAALVDEFKAIVKKETGQAVPDRAADQLRLAVEAVFGSWFGQRAKDYRKQFKISDDLGTRAAS